MSSKVTFNLPNTAGGGPKGSSTSASSSKEGSSASKALAVPPKGERRRLESLVKAAAESSEGLPALLNPNATVDELLTNSGSAARALSSGARTTSGSEIGLSLIDPGQAKAVEIYGFSLFLITWAALIAFLLWAYLPEGTLHAIGVSYFPDRYWALGAPAMLLMIVMFYATMWGLYGMASNPHIDSFDSMVDGYSKHYLHPKSQALMAAGTAGGGVTSSSSSNAASAGNVLATTVTIPTSATGLVSHYAHHHHHHASSSTSGSLSATGYHQDARMRWGYLASKQSQKWKTNLFSSRPSSWHAQQQPQRSASGGSESQLDLDLALSSADQQHDGTGSTAFHGSTSGSLGSSWGYRSRSASAGQSEGISGGGATGLGPVSITGLPLRPQQSSLLLAAPSADVAGSSGSSRTPTHSPQLSPRFEEGLGGLMNPAFPSSSSSGRSFGSSATRPRGSSCPPSSQALLQAAAAATGGLENNKGALYLGNKGAQLSPDQRTALLAHISPHRLHHQKPSAPLGLAFGGPPSRHESAPSSAGTSGSSWLPSGVSKLMGTPDIADLPPPVVNRLQFLGPLLRRRVRARAKAAARMASHAAATAALTTTTAAEEE
jgi:PIG-P